MKAFKHYLSIQTNFSRKNESIVTLVALSSKRRLELDSEPSTTNIPATIRQHFLKNEGLCSIFGKITKYHHFHSEYEYDAYDVGGIKIGAGKIKKQMMESAFIA